MNLYLRRNISQESLDRNMIFLLQSRSYIKQEGGKNICQYDHIYVLVQVNLQGKSH